MYFEFVIHITEDPLDGKRLPDKFAEFLASWEPAKVHPPEGSYRVCCWPVKVLFAGQGTMYLDRAFNKFARDHNLEVGMPVALLLRS
jgi:hypothetical protein